MSYARWDLPSDFNARIKIFLLTRISNDKLKKLSITSGRWFFRFEIFWLVVECSQAFEPQFSEFFDDRSIFCIETKGVESIALENFTVHIIQILCANFRWEDFQGNTDSKKDNENCISP